MPLFRRRDETMNEILLREAGLAEPQQEPRSEPESRPDAAPQPAPLDPYAGTYPADSVFGGWQRAMARPDAADATAVVRAPQIAGDDVEFVALPSGDLIVDVEKGDADLSPLADAVEATLAPPYRARAQRQHADLWGVAASRIDVRRFSCEAGDEIELVVRGGRMAMRVDGAASSLRIPELERAGEEQPGGEYAVHAERIDGDFWEIRASAL
jgi:hypothetical protein